MSGVNANPSALTSYIENNTSFWTMTPYEYDGNTYMAIYMFSSSSSFIDTNSRTSRSRSNVPIDVNSNFIGIRPVISIYPSGLIGNGTMNDPFRIE